MTLYLSTQPKLDEYGVLCKRLTCLSHTDQRMQFAFTAFDYCLHRHCDLVEAQIKANTLMPASQDWIGCIHLLQFMKMMHTFTRGWESGELSSLLQQLDTSFKISDDLITVSTFDRTSITDVKLFLHLKYEVRFCRKVFSAINPLPPACRHPLLFL